MIKLDECKIIFIINSPFCKQMNGRVLPPQSQSVHDPSPLDKHRHVEDPGLPSRQLLYTICVPGRFKRHEISNSYIYSLSKQQITAGAHTVKTKTTY